MDPATSQYPDYLNPFGDEDEEKDSEGLDEHKHDEYPDYLSPFGAGDEATTQNIQQKGATLDDYDDSLNPFGGEDVTENAAPKTLLNTKEVTKQENSNQGNPFEEESDQVLNEAPQQDNNKSRLNDIEEQVSKSGTPQPDSLEPPKPLPRTKSLLKKEQAQVRRQQQQQRLSSDHNQTTSLQSTTSLLSLNANTAPAIATTGSFQRKKNKRNAPPVPINFKRQVSGSLDAIEEELNDIGDKLAIIEKESYMCQETLKAKNEIDEANFATTRNKFVELIKRKNSIVRRQKELMYKKRELKLDQIHSDIEYELRMIGNKQLSHRTTEDEMREKELLKKLVEIVEEKNDIVENLNRDTSCDNQDIKEAFKRLNIVDHLAELSDKKRVNNSPDITVKNENCDKSSLAKLSKIATLLPKSGTIKGTIKIKRKRLFKKNCDSRPIER